MALSGYYYNELERVDKASKRVREVMDGLSPAFFIAMLSVEGVVTYANKTSLEAIGLERKDVLGKKIEDTPWWGYSELQRHRLRKAVDQAALGEPSRFDMMFHDITGRQRFIDFAIYPVFDAKKKTSYLVASGHDVTERRKAERALNMINECQHLLLRVDNEQRLLQNICQLIMSHGGYDLVWVGYACKDSQKTIQPQAFSGVTQPVLTDYLSWSSDSEAGQCPSGQCIRLNKTVICRDIQDVDWVSERFKNEAANRGLCGGITLPLHNQDGAAFGSLSIVSSVPFDVTLDELRLLEGLAENLSYGIRNLRTKQENKDILAIVYKIADVVSLATGELFYQKLMLAATEALGAEVGFITRLQHSNPLMSRSVALVVDGKLLDNMDIPLPNTPCADLSEINKEWIVNGNVSEMYPLAESLKTFGAQAYIGRRIENSTGNHTGQMVLLFRKPLENTALVSAVFKVFAARVAGEFERQAQEDDHVYKI